MIDSAAPNQSSRYLPLLLLLFAGSGCAALIYEVIWYQMLALVVGSTSISMGVVLATFMGGLCIGSIWLPRLRGVKQHPLHLYAMIEAGIGVLALLVVLLLPFVQNVYFAASGSGFIGMLTRALISGICLLPPTILMGASLPAASRWIQSTPRGASWWGLLYGTNTAGAVFGCLIAGFYLLRLYNVTVATLVGAAFNLAVAALSFWLSTRTPAQTELTDATAAPEPVEEDGDSPWPVYVTIALSGATALGAEVVWTRLMGMLLGATVYVFSIILAVFLIGLAIGSTVGSWIARSLRRSSQARLALGWCQLFLIFGIAWTAYMIAESLPYWPINPLLTNNPWFSFQIDMARTLWAVLPPTLLWGASFPLALAAVRPAAKDPAETVGAVYAANTLGAIVGALLVSLVLVPSIGTRDSQRALLLASAVSCWFVIVPYVRRHKSMLLAGALAASAVVAFSLSSKINAVPGELIAFGRKISTSIGHAQILYTAEGRNSSLAISRWEDGALQIDVNGHVEATTEPYDMKLQRMVGHLAGLMHPNPKSVLGIGFGAGVSAGTFTRYPTVEHITVCEIEPMIPPTSTRYFGRQNYTVMLNPKTNIHYDDARHYMMTTSNHYDIIASDPLDVFVKGTAALYTKEYFEAVKRHLNPGGMFTLYVPLYESDERTVRSELATFFEAFPNSTIWANTIDGQGYDMVFMGHLDPPRINIDELQERLNRPEYAPVAESLREIEMPGPLELLSTYMGRNGDLGAWTAGAEINRDRDLRLSYLGGWGINSDLANPIYKRMMSFRRLEQHPFTGSPEHVQELLRYLGGR